MKYQIFASDFNVVKDAKLYISSDVHSNMAYAVLALDFSRGISEGYITARCEGVIDAVFADDKFIGWNFSSFRSHNFEYDTDISNYVDISEEAAETAAKEIMDYYIHNLPLQNFRLIQPKTQKFIFKE